MLYSFSCLWGVSIKQKKNPAIRLNNAQWLGIIVSPFAGVGSLYLYTNDQFGTLGQLSYYAFAPTFYAGICAWRGLNAKKGIGSTQSLSRRQLPFTKKIGLLLSYLYFSFCLLLLLISMGDTLLSVGYNAVGDLLSPINVINWCFLLALASPGILLRMISLSTSRAKTEGIK